MTSDNYSSSNQTTLASFIHLSVFTKFFIPFGNYLIPLILWVTNKDKSEFIDRHGKQAINFQLSLLLYTIIFGMFSIPFFMFNFFGDIGFFDALWSNDISFHISKVTGMRTILSVIAIGFIAIISFFFEIVLVIIAALRAKSGELYHYPLTIQFLK